MISGLNGLRPERTENWPPLMLTGSTLDVVINYIATMHYVMFLYKNPNQKSLVFQYQNN